MISLDQVMLLEQKVESAVAKIQQLQAENDALRSKCLELTNALSSKSEQLSSFENDQNQIETGIKKALDRLDFIEQSVLSKGQVSFTSSTAPVVEDPISVAPSFDMMDEAPAPESEEPLESEENNIPEEEPALVSEPEFTEEEEISIEKSFETDEFIPEDSYADDESQDGLGFDIF